MVTSLCYHRLQQPCQICRLVCWEHVTQLVHSSALSWIGPVHPSHFFGSQRYCLAVAARSECSNETGFWLEYAWSRDACFIRTTLVASRLAWTANYVPWWMEFTLDRIHRMPQLCHKKIRLQDCAPVDIINCLKLQCRLGNGENAFSYARPRTPSPALRTIADSKQFNNNWRRVILCASLLQCNASVDFQLRQAISEYDAIQTASSVFVLLPCAAFVSSVFRAQNWNAKIAKHAANVAPPYKSGTGNSSELNCNEWIWSKPWFSVTLSDFVRL